MNVQPSWLNRLPGIGRYYRYGLPLFPGVVDRLILKDYDLVISSSHCVAKGVFPGGGIHISYIHSPMRYVWDMHDAYFGPAASWPVRIGMAFCRAYLQRWDLQSARRVDYFIANSEHIAEKIENLYKREAAVIYPPVDIDKFYIAEHTDPFFLIVSALVPYKNIALAISAFNRLQLPLKIVGEGPLKKSLEKRAGPSIEFLGWVEDSRLAELYAGCEAVVFPGEEDFGIVPLEAQASGRPVIAYGKGGARESVTGIDDRLASGGCPTGIFFSHATPASLMEAVERYYQIKHVFEPAALRYHASRFSRAAFKTQINEFINAKLPESPARWRQNAETP